MKKVILTLGRVTYLAKGTISAPSCLRLCVTIFAAHQHGNAPTDTIALARRDEYTGQRYLCHLCHTTLVKPAATQPRVSMPFNPQRSAFWQCINERFF